MLNLDVGKNGHVWGITSKTNQVAFRTGINENRKQGTGWKISTKQLGKGNKIVLCENG